VTDRQQHGYEASIIYATLAGGTFRWDCKHKHRTDVLAFACGTREVRRRFATARPRTDLRAFNLITNPVLTEAGES